MKNKILMLITALFCVVLFFNCRTTVINGINDINRIIDKERVSGEVGKILKENIASHHEYSIPTPLPTSTPIPTPTPVTSTDFDDYKKFKSEFEKIRKQEVQ